MKIWLSTLFFVALLGKNFGCDVSETNILCTKLSSIDNIPSDKNAKKLTIIKSQIQTLNPSEFSAFSNLEILTLGQSHLEVIKEGAFDGLNDLKELRLYKNNLTSENLDGKAFDSLETLEFLDLDYNQITYINKSWFLKLNNLKKLLIGFNNITSVDAGFAVLKSLKLLDLGGNPIDTVNEELPPALASLSLTRTNLEKLNFTLRIWNLDVLYLSYNKLRVLDKPVFGSAKASLQHVAFTDDMISTIDAYYFRELFNLKRLLLARNRIQVIDPTLFQDLHSLDFLDLSANLIQDIASGTFDALKKLTDLNISRNKLLNLNSNSFNSMINLKILNFENNLISSFDIDNILARHEALETVALNSNRWNCKDAEYILNTLKKHDIFFGKTQRYDVENFKGIACSNSKETEIQKESASIKRMPRIRLFLKIQRIPSRS